MFFEYIWLAWYGTSAGRFEGPRIVTPCATTISSGRVSSQLPPRSAARSTTTDPGGIAVDHLRRDEDRRALAGNQRRGDDDVAARRRPSASSRAAGGRTTRPAPSRSRPCPRRRRSRARSSTNLRAEALDLLLDGRAARRRPRTLAPSRRAVAMACSPATPAPTMKTRAGAIVPAAVISIGNMRGSAFGGQQHRLVAGDGRHRRQHVHALGARDARHQLHREEALTPVGGERPDGIGRAKRIGEADDRLARPEQRRVGRHSTHLQHDVRRAEQLRARHHHGAVRSERLVVNPAAVPAPGSTTTSSPAFTRGRTAAGMTATRGSPGQVSFGIPTLISLKV